MATEYGYISLTDLENFMGLDISTRQAELTDAKVESMITLAERLINGYIGASLTDAPDAIQSVTMIIASNIVHNYLLRETTIVGNEKEVFDETSKSMLNTYISKEQQDSVDLINTYSGRHPMYGTGGWYFPW